MTLSLPESADDCAWFLDFDGTLVAIAERPDAVSLDRQTRACLAALHAATRGSVAIVTGREIADIDALLAPLRLPVAGAHGLTRRDARGLMHCAPVEDRLAALAESVLQPLVRATQGLLIEYKSHGVACHYRGCPDAEPECRAAMQDLARRLPGMHLIAGKMVIEARPAGGDKGTAVAAFLAEPPFAGKRALFAGDDVTDEDAFRVVNAMDGLSIKIGPGETQARFRTADTTTFLAWLGRVAATPHRDTGERRG